MKCLFYFCIFQESFPVNPVSFFHGVIQHQQRTNEGEVLMSCSTPRGLVIEQKCIRASLISAIYPVFLIGYCVCTDIYFYEFCSLILCDFRNTIYFHERTIICITVQNQYPFYCMLCHLYYHSKET